MSLALRLSAYLTLIVGVAMFFGWVERSEPATTVHLILGIATPGLALAAVSGGPGPRRTLRRVARVWPLLTAAVGLGIFFKLTPAVVVMVHALLGLLTIALLEMALGKKARSLG